ncbi:MAG: tyrosine-type recombinase/integrase [Anaerolineales bacterium]|nr:tyrosine-type recombinase/integrase [Anaerolineales bacterium]
MPRDELPAFLRQLEAYDGEVATRLALKLIILTMVRTKELRGAEWREFEDLGGDAPLWRIPASRMKMPREHLVPLPDQAVEILDALHPLTGWSPYLFPSGGKKRRYERKHHALCAIPNGLSLPCHGPRIQGRRLYRVE